jgi:hypothetical protein
VNTAVRRLGRCVGGGADATATCLFVLPLFTAGIAKDSAKIELLGLVLLGFLAFVILRRPVPGRALIRIGLTAAALTLVLCAYLTFGSWPSRFGTTSSYDSQAVIFVVTYVAVAAFTALFFGEQLFERVIWRTATLALWLGVISCLVSRITQRILLVSASHGALRMEGTLSEPSAWAPVIPLVMILAIQRRSWLHLALAIGGAVLAASPTCVVVLAISLPLYYVLTGAGRQRVLVVLALAVSIPAAVFFAQAARPARYLASHNTAEQAVGRLLSGVENVETDGRVGHNTRFASTRVIIAEAQANGWMLTGAGPAADSTYLTARFPAGTRPEPYRASSLWTGILVDFGEVGVVVLAILMLTSIWRMRTSPVMCAILLPFFVASLVNSAEGSFEYVFVALGVMLFAFRWIPVPGSTSSAVTIADGSSCGTAVSRSLEVQSHLSRLA